MQGCVSLNLKPPAFEVMLLNGLTAETSPLMSLQTQLMLRDLLTAGSFAVVTEIALLWLHGDARLFPHLVDLRHAQLGVEVEKQASVQNGQVVLIPVPQVLQALVVDGGERVHPDDGKRQARGYLLAALHVKKNNIYHLVTA